MSTADGFERPDKDLLFKKIFSNERILNDFIKSFYEYIGKREEFEVLKTIPQELLFPKNKKGKHYYGDIVATLSNDTIISLEIYTNTFGEGEYNKSYMYASRIFSNQRFENYKEIKRVVSINLITNNFKRMNKEIVNEYNFENIVTHEIINKNIEMYLVRYDLAEKEKDDSKFIRYLQLLSKDSVKEMKKVVKGDDIMEETLRTIIDWNEDNNVVLFEDWYMDRYGDRVRENLKAIGEERATIKIAKNMIDSNLPEEYIERITGLSKKEIKRLTKNK